MYIIYIYNIVHMIYYMDIWDNCDTYYKYTNQLVFVVHSKH